MGREDDGDSEPFLEREDEVLNLLGGDRIKVRGGFIQEKDIRFRGDCPGDGHPLHLSSGECPCLPIFIALEPYQLERFRHPGLYLVLADVPEYKPDGDIVINSSTEG